MPEAMKANTTDRDTLRKMCAIRGIEFHHAQKSPSLQKLIDEYEERNAPPGDLEDQVEVANTGFASSEPQTPDWPTSPFPGPFDPSIATENAATETKPSPGAKEAVSKVTFQAAEHFTPSNHELPGNVADALKWFGAYSIGCANIVKRYIESLHAR